MIGRMTGQMGGLEGASAPAPGVRRRELRLAVDQKDDLTPSVTVLPAVP